MSIATITPRDLHELRQAGKQVDLIDVRTPAEFGEVHADGAVLAPLDRLDPRAVMEGRADGQDRPLYVICKSGSRARQACEKFQAAGCTNVVCVEGGTAAWEQAGLPVQRGRKAVSLDRQMRILMGLVVLAGVALAVGTGSFWWLGISAFVGAGMVYAGVSDNCPMANLVARMPWNQAGPATCAVQAPAAPASRETACCSH